MLLVAQPEINLLRIKLRLYTTVISGTAGYVGNMWTDNNID